MAKCVAAQLQAVDEIGVRASSGLSSGDTSTIITTH